MAPPLGGERVRVYTRIRPASSRERSNGVPCSAVDETTIGVTSDAVTQRQQERKRRRKEQMGKERR